MHNTTGWLLLALTEPPFNSTPIRVSLVTRPHSKAVPETADPSRHNTRATAENANLREQFMEVESSISLVPFVIRDFRPPCGRPPGFERRLRGPARDGCGQRV